MSFASASGGIGLREEMCRSEPSSAFAWVSMPVCTLALREWIATSAAMPATMASEKSARRCRCVRLSRQAMRHVHGCTSAARQRARERRRRFIGGIFLLGDDGSAAHLDHAARAGGERGIVRDQHQRGAGFAIQPEEHLDDRAARLRIEIAGGLIGEKDLRPMDESAGQRHALLFAAGKLERVMMEPLGEADLRENIRRLLLAPVLAPKLQRHEHILERGERGDELKVLKDEADEPIAQRGARVLVERLQRLAAQPHGAGGGVIQPRAEAEQRGLAAAGGADDRAGVAGGRASD